MAASLRAVCADPVRFVRGVLGHDPWDVPEQILRAVDQPHARVAVKSCHASGKTHTAAEAVISHVARHADGIAVTTAPTWTQVKDVLWREIREALAQARVAFPKPSTVRWSIGTKQYAMGLSTNEGVRFQGFHGRMLIPVDEAAGVRPDIIEAAKGIAAGGDVRFLWLGNPTIPSGPFYDVFRTRPAGWTLLTISAFDTPNFAGLGPAQSDGRPPEALLALDADGLAQTVRPYLITRRWVREMWDECDQNPQHPFWQARVLGEFPSQADDALYPLAWLERARRQWLEMPEDGTALVAGIDVAGPGEDETVLVVRTSGPTWRVRMPEAWRTPEPQQHVTQALAACGPQLTGGAVDVIGIGHYFLALLQDGGVSGLTGVNVAEAPRDPRRFVNRKAELCWALRERLRDGLCALPPDETLFAQLAGLRYGHDARGRVLIESKDAARRRGVKSPDRAEALILTCALDGDVWTETADRRANALPEADDDVDALLRPGLWM